MQPIAQFKSTITIKSTNMTKCLQENQICCRMPKAQASAVLLIHQEN